MLTSILRSIHHSGRSKTGSKKEALALKVAVDLNRSQSAQLSPTKACAKRLPANYELVESRDLVLLIANMIMELIYINDKLPSHRDQVTRFHSRSPPQISVYNYLQRWAAYAHLSPSLLLSMVYVIDQLCLMDPALTVNSLTIHRFLMASATVASKGLSDSFWTNSTYAQIGGISPSELATLELEFLFRVQWHILPEPQRLVNYYYRLVERCNGCELERAG
ncbi:hypothetical protein N7486_009493 [Penicillium sp. IBT 16267x]|nr:hypothetical protein N7486_009493 [Penicillium sp. IBT 16267x]